MATPSSTTPIPRHSIAGIESSTSPSGGIKRSSNINRSVSGVRIRKNKHRLPRKEDLAGSALNLKLQMNSLTEENIRLKTQVQALHNEIRKQDKLINELSKDPSANTVARKAQEHVLSANLKKQLRDANAQLESREQEIIVLKHSMNYTYTRELEEERDTFIHESRRLRTVL